MRRQLGIWCVCVWGGHLSKLALRECRALTSQSGGEQEMGPVFLDQGLGDLLEAGPPPQQANVADEFWSQRQRQAEEIFPFQGQVVHLPASKFPAGEAEKQQPKSQAHPKICVLR